eukprot:gb/GEZN01012352.1/.p1 GENE.gb/GEZN01012352.1/~~gb/GEZN01012352.1/.p1  ORF type:complete len:216 (-),score=20.48 gb/GEZN01012352.1/:378-1025(-)
MTEAECDQAPHHENARPFKRARKEATESVDQGSPTEKHMHHRIVFEERTPVNKQAKERCEAMKERSEQTKELAKVTSISTEKALPLSDYMRQHPLSERKEFICINIRNTKMFEYYFEGPEEGFGIRPVSLSRMSAIAYPGPELTLEIRCNAWDDIYDVVTHRKKLVSRFGKFYVAQLAAEIIAAARTIEGCDPQMTRLELFHGAEHALLVAEFGH